MQDTHSVDTRPAIFARHYHILLAEPGKQQTVVALNSKVICAAAHWTTTPDGRRRESPCHAVRENCPYCLMHQRRYWKVLLGAWHPPSNLLCAVQLSLDALKRCPDLYPKSGVNLRGRQVHFGKSGPSKMSPIFAKLGIQVGYAAQLAEPFDLTETLSHLWQVEPDGLVFSDDPR